MEPISAIEDLVDEREQLRQQRKSSRKAVQVDKDEIPEVLGVPKDKLPKRRKRDERESFKTKPPPVEGTTPRDAYSTLNPKLNI